MSRLAILTDGVRHHHIHDMINPWLHNPASGHPLCFVVSESVPDPQTAKTTSILCWIVNDTIDTTESRSVLAHVHGSISTDADGVMTMTISAIRRELWELPRTISSLSDGEWGVLGRFVTKAGGFVGKIELNLCKSGLDHHKTNALLGDRTIISNLTALDMSYNQLGPGMQVVLEALRWGRKLRSLNLSNNEWSGNDSSAQYLGEILSQSTLLTSIDLSSNPVDADSLQRIGHAMGWNSTIHRVRISDLDSILVGYHLRNDHYGLACCLAKVNHFCGEFNYIYMAMKTVIPCLLSQLIKEKTDTGGDGPSGTRGSGKCDGGDSTGEKKKKKKKKARIYIYKPQYPR